MKKRQMFTFVNKFKEIEELQGFNFVIAMTKNFNKFKEEVILLEKGKRPSKEYQEFLAKREEILKTFSIKDEKGHPAINSENGVSSYEIKKDQLENFQKEIATLEEEYKSAIETQMNLFSEFEKELEKEIDFTLFKVAESDLPKEITAKQINLIFDLVNWE